jgi:hypothetical protein
MEVKIGVQQSPRELTVEVDDDAEQVEQAVRTALGEESGLLTLTDTKGRRVLVPTAKLAYVELGSPSSGQVGFRS